MTDTVSLIHPPQEVGMAKLPPGPRSALLATIEYARDPLGFVHKYARHYGDPFTVNLLFTGPVVVTGDPQGLRQIFTAPPDTFASLLRPLVEPQAGPNSLLLLDGARHKRERTLLLPPFHGTRMRAYGQLMQEVAQRYSAAWRPGQTFNILDTMQSISL